MRRKTETNNKKQGKQGVGGTIKTFKDSKFNQTTVSAFRNEKVGKCSCVLKKNGLGQFLAQCSQSALPTDCFSG